MTHTPATEPARQILFCLLYDRELQHELFLLVVDHLADRSCECILRRLAALQSDQDWREGFTYWDGAWWLNPSRHDRGNGAKST